MRTAGAKGLRALRNANCDRLLELLRLHGALHRAELARRSGLSRTTVSTIVAALIDAGVVSEVDGANGVAGDAGLRRPRGLLTLNPEGRAVVGVDFSFQQVRVVVADLAHQIRGEGFAPLEPDQSWSESIELGLATIDKALAVAGVGRAQVIGVGLGLPGPIDRTSGALGRSSNSVAWAGIHAGQELSSLLGVPVYQENTSRLAALAEATWGAGRGCDDLIFVKLAAGVGSGLVFGGHIFRGSVGAAGELGHITVDENGPACRCGNRGCLETYARVPAVLAALRPAFGDDVALPQVLAASAAGDRAARRVISDVGRVVGTALAGVCNLLNPSRIIIGGDLAPAGDELLVPLRSSLRRHALPMTFEAVTVVVAELGDRAGALGGVALVLHEGEPVAMLEESMPVDTTLVLTGGSGR